LGTDILAAEPLPYRPDSLSLFSAVAHRPWAMLLDSGVGANGPERSAGLYDILVAAPRVTLETRGTLTRVRSDAGSWVSPEDPFALVRRCLGPTQDLPSDWPPGLPFPGGALGYFGYDLARRLERLPAQRPDSLGFPDLAIGIYDQALVVDHGVGRTWLVGRNGAAPRSRNLLRLVAKGVIPYAPGQFRITGALRSNMDLQGYAQRFGKIQEWIQSGDCYQVNLAQRFSVSANGDPWAAYLTLRGLSPAPFAAYINTPWGRVLSSSPERFLRLVGDRVETRPIKGTRARGSDCDQDRQLAAALAASSKDRAENLMIVDLLRNDLGRSCAPGTIRVPGLFEVETYPGVHHLVSTVTGRLAAGMDALDLLRGCFPGGSVTGAPKIRAMQIIDSLEGEPRGVYCGSVVCLGFDGSLDSNILIRTMAYARGELRYWAGGGIVADSDSGAEWQEIATKASAMHEVVTGLSAGYPQGK
jgi:para-aminobenzoate synthetase component I